MGLALRLVAELSWWPVETTLGDAYEAHASNPFQNELHPAGYSAIIGLIGMVTRQVAAPVILQHLTGIASALLLWAATRRITRSDWAGLLPAAVVLLDPDFIFLEHSIMSESWFVLAICAGLYASVRALDEPHALLALAGSGRGGALRRRDDPDGGAAPDRRWRLSPWR